MATEDQILLKLVIKGMDPAEVQRLAQQSGEQLNSAMKVQLDKLTELHRQAAQARTAAEVAAVKKQIDEHEKLLDSIGKVARAQEIATNRMSGNWRRLMEDLENITTVFEGVWHVVEAGAQRFERFAEESSRTTQIYASLKGSIDEFREATDGEIADIDLITTKNRAFQKELSLTDEQFGIVGAAAKNFADALGTNTKDALDQIIDGLATGRTKMLEHAGVVIDTEKAYATYAKSIGVAVDQLSEHGKKTAIVQESLRAMDRKLADSGQAVENFGNDWEKLTAEITNFKTKVELVFAEFVHTLIHRFQVELPAAIKIGFAKVEDAITLGRGHFADKAIAAYQAQLAAETRAAGQAAAEAQKRLAENSAYSAKVGGGANDRKAGKAGDFEPNIGSFFGVKRAGDTERERNDLLQTLAERAQPAVTAEEGAKSADQIAKMIQDETDQFDKAIADVLKAREDALADLSKAAGEGAGFVNTMLFGIAGPGATIDQINMVTDSINEMTSMISNSAHAMADALGASLAASIAGSDAHRKHFRTLAHDILESLAAQALGQAIFQTAMGLADLALAAFGNPAAAASAGLHFASAAAFASLGGVAAISARAVGTNAADATGAKGAASRGAGAVNPSSAQSSFGGSSRQSTDTAQAPPPIYLAVFPGGEDAAGRAVLKALDAHYAMNGTINYPGQRAA